MVDVGKREDRMLEAIGRLVQNRDAAINYLDQLHMAGKISFVDLSFLLAILTAGERDE